MVFCSNRPGGLGGFDLWECKRRNLHEPFGEAVNLGPAINSENDEILGELSGDGLELLTRQDAEWWRTRRTTIDKPFGPLKRFDIPGIAGEQSVESVHLSSDGYFLVMDVYSHPAHEFWLASRSSLDSSFNSPVHLGVSRFVSPTMTADARTLFFNKGTGEPKRRDLWTSHRVSTDKPFGPVTKLGPPLNSDSNDDAPWISGDGMTLYFASGRPGNIGPKDIWMCRRLPDDLPADRNSVSPSRPPQDVSTNTPALSTPPKESGSTESP
jgi:hypothetical protein